jgi:hypothetical protein
MNNVDRNAVIHGKHKNSRAAADAYFLKSGSWRKLVYVYVASKGSYGATDQEIQEHLDKSGDTIRPTRKTLEKDGLIVDSNRTRKNAAGNDCVIWVTYEWEGQLF